MATFTAPLEHKAPQNSDLERTVLGLIILDNRHFQDIAVLQQIPDLLGKVKDYWAGITEETKKAFETQTKYFSSALQFQLQLQDKLARVSGQGLTGSNKSVFDIEADKKELALTKELIATLDAARTAKSHLSSKDIDKPTIVDLLKEASQAADLLGVSLGFPDININAAEKTFREQAGKFADELIAVGDQAKQTQQELALVTIPTTTAAAGRERLKEQEEAAKKLHEAVKSLATAYRALNDEEEKYSISASRAAFEVTKGLEAAIPLQDIMKQQLQDISDKMVFQVGLQVARGKSLEAWRAEIAQMDDAIFAASHPRFELMKTLNQSLTSSFDSMFSDIALGTRGLSQAFESMAASIAASVLQTVAKMLILGPLLRALSGLLGAFAPTSAIPLFGGRGLPLGPGDFAVGPPHAGGGPVMPNVAYMTGELGPELFVPRTAGTIIPNSGLGGAQIINRVNVINQTSSPVSAQIGKSVFNGKEYVTNVILQDFASNGPIRRALGS
jgi:hypothetical protein